MDPRKRIKVLSKGFRDILLMNVEIKIACAGGEANLNHNLECKNLIVISCCDNIVTLNHKCKTLCWGLRPNIKGLLCFPESLVQNLYPLCWGASPNIIPKDN